MKKFEGMLMCTDLDGTLFKKDKTVSKENKEAIEYFKSEGGLFTFITGRMPYFSSFVCDIINPNCAFGCINGGGVYDRDKGYLWTKELSKTSYQLIDYIAERIPDIGVQINTFETIYFLKENSATDRFKRIVKLDGFEEGYPPDDIAIAKIVFCDEKEENIQDLQNIIFKHPLAGEFDFIRSERTLYEILPMGIDKGVALKKLSEIMNIDRKRTIAIGDFNNDIGMLRFAGLGVAVSNAREEVKEAADYITVSNEESAIAAIITDIDSGRIKI